MIYHVEHNFTDNEVAFLRNLLKTAKEGTPWHISQETLIPAGIRIRYNTAEKRMERIRRDHNLYGNSSYGIVVLYEDPETGDPLFLGATNAPGVLIEKLKAKGIDIMGKWPNIGNNDMALIVAIEQTLFSDDRAVMKKHKLITDYCIVKYEMLPYSFVSAESAETFAKEYTSVFASRCSGLKYKVSKEEIRPYNMADKDDFHKLAAILEQIRFCGPDSEDR